MTIVHSFEEWFAIETGMEYGLITIMHDSCIWILNACVRDGDGCNNNYVIEASQSVFIYLFSEFLNVEKQTHTILRFILLVYMECFKSSFHGTGDWIQDIASVMLIFHNAWQQT